MICCYPNCIQSANHSSQCCDLCCCDEHRLTSESDHECIFLITLKLTSFQGKSFQIKMRKEETVLDIKKEIYRQKNIQPLNQILSKNGFILINSSTIMTLVQEYGTDLFLYFEVTDFEYLSEQFSDIPSFFRISTSALKFIRLIFEKYTKNIPPTKLEIALANPDLKTLLTISSSCLFSKIFYCGNNILNDDQLEIVNNKFFSTSIEYTQNVEIMKMCKIIVVNDVDWWNENADLIVNENNIVLLGKNIKEIKNYVELHNNSMTKKAYQCIQPNIQTERFNHQMIIHTIHKLYCRILNTTFNEFNNNEFVELEFLISFFQLQHPKNLTKEEFITYMTAIINTEITNISKLFEEKSLLKVLDSFLAIVCLVTIKLSANYFYFDIDDTQIIKTIDSMELLLTGYLDIKHNFSLSNLGVTFIINYITSGNNLDYVMKCYEKRRFVYTINGLVKETLLNSLKNIIQTPKGRNALQILDGQEFNAENELQILEELINDDIISIPSEIQLAGKVALGGTICIQKLTMDYHNMYPIGVARFFVIYRHELAHRKYLIKAVNQNYRDISPEVNDGEHKKNESGFFLDQATYGIFNLTKKPSITDNIEDGILIKLINGEELNADQINKIFTIDIIVDEEMQKTYNLGPGKSKFVFCEGMGTLYYD